MLFRVVHPSSRPRSAPLCAGILAALVLHGAAAASAGAAQDEAAFRERAGRWAARNCVEIAEGEGVAPLLERAFLRIELGSFELRVPSAAFADAATRTTLATVSRDLVDLEERWCAWSSVDPASAARARPAAQRLTAWIATWSKADFPAGTLAGRDLLDLLEAGAPIREGGATLRELLAGERTARLVLLPTREEFVELAAAAGLADPAMRPAFWAAGPELWTEYTLAGNLALALEYASPHSTEDYRRAIPMTAENPRGQREHVAVLAAGELLDAVHEGRLEPLFAGALANVLVIDLFGELDTRADGDLRAHTTPGRSIFVPGGKPRGGKLPRSRADSRWRALQGEDHFVGVLAASQTEGGSSAAERWQRISSFALRLEGQFLTWLSRH
jgi:hypothetical protein